MKMWLCLAAALLSVTGLAPASAQPRSIDRPGTIAHAAAGAHFPERVGEFRRSNVHQFDEAGEDISASYNLLRGGDRLLITVYVYPAARIGSAPGSGGTADIARASLCQQEMRGVGEVIENQHRGARRVEEGAAPAVAGVGPGLNLRSVHRFTGQFSGSAQEIRSETDLYCFVGGRWIVKYRASSNGQFDATPEIEAFIRSGPWPGRAAPADPGKVAAAPASGAVRG